MTQCWVYERREVTLEDVQTRCTERGFEVRGRDEQGIRLERNGVVLRVRREEVEQVAAELPHACSMRRARHRWVLEPSSLSQALDESNALIDAQLTLQTSTRGYLHLGWNDEVQPPDRATPAAASIGKLWGAAMKRGLTPMMKEAGFTKKGQCFHRSQGSATHRLAFRKSGARYHLDVGWSLKEAAALGGGECPIVIAGETVMFSAPVVDTPIETWNLTLDTDLDDLALDLVSELGRVVAALDRIDGPRAMLEHVDLSPGFYKLDRARLKLLLGDEAGARADVTLVAEAFADRPGVTLDGLMASVRGED